jgi:hypothetical protein
VQAAAELLAMPVIVTTPEEIDAWMTASSNEAFSHRRPLP